MGRRKMDLIKAKYFLKIVDTGSMTRAADILNISPSALSKATQSLQNELGLKLIMHSGKNILITSYGQTFASEVRKILRDVELMKERLHTQAQPTSQIRIATFEVFLTYFLSVLNDLPWSEQSLVLHDGLPGEIETAVAEQKVDFGITYQPVPLPEIDLLKITSVEMGVFTNPTAFRNIAQPDLPFVVPVAPLGRTPPSRLRGLDGWPADAYDRKVKFEVTLMESALELVRQGRAAGYFPKFVVTEHNRKHKSEFQLVRRRSPFIGRICTTDVYLIKRRRDEESAILKQIARQLRKLGYNG